MDRKLTLDDGHDGTLLNGGWTLETIGVDTCSLLIPKLPKLDISYRTSEELSLQVHGIEGVDGLVIVGLDLSCLKFLVSFWFSKVRVHLAPAVCS
jgi:hypothetical protein